MNLQTYQLNANKYDSKSVIISSLNVKGLKGNLLYSKYLASCSSVVFLCELWTKPNDINLVKEIVKDTDKNFLYKSDIDPHFKKGRPFGGQCWLVDNAFKIIENKFIYKHISFLHLKTFDHELAFIGVYMNFEDQKNRNESKSSYELSLSIILAIQEDFGSRNIPVIITDDFNGDINSLIEIIRLT